MKVKLFLRSLVLGLILLVVVESTAVAMSPVGGKLKNPYNVTHQYCENTMAVDC